MCGHQVSQEKSAKRASRAYKTAWRELNSLVELLNEALGLQLVLPPLGNLDLIKEFCSSLIEKKGHHPWQATVMKSTTQWWTVAASLFLFRKRIPSPIVDERSVINSFVHRMSTPMAPVRKDFLDHAASMVDRLFPVGWDERYGEYVSRAIPGGSATLNTTRQDGGCRTEWCGDFEGFVGKALGEVPFTLSGDVRVSNVRENGKNRLVTISEAESFVLSPLHSLIYDHLSRYEWLLRGDATPKSFRDFTHKPGELFVSGDYESATDNIPSEVYELLLNRVLSRCVRVPDSVKAACRTTVHCNFVDSRGNRLGTQQRGQLMGNFLSFPLLCLLNFIAFKFAVRRRVPLRINGDDIVFRCNRDEAERWFQTVGDCGLTVSPGKTLVEERYFSLNSTFFRASSLRVRSVPFIRSKCLFKNPSYLQGLRDQYLSFCPGFGGRRRGLLRSAFLRIHERNVWRSRRAITRDLELPASWRVLQDAHLSAREAKYLAYTPPAPVLPMPPTTSEWASQLTMDGWVRREGARTAQRRKEEECYWDEVHRRAWNSWLDSGYEFTDFTVTLKEGPCAGFPDLVATYWATVRSGCFRLPEVSSSRRRKLLGMSLRTYNRSFGRVPVVSLPCRSRPRQFYYARKEEVRNGPICFVSAH